MKNFLIFLLIGIFINTHAKAEFEILSSPNTSIAADSIKLSKNGILLGENGYNYSSMPFNGLYLDNSGNLDFKPKVLGSLKITDVDEDLNYFYATSYMVISGNQGLFKISKDFSQIQNIGIKASMRKVLVYKDKVYIGGITHGCYVLDKTGTNLTQIIGDGYYGPFIDDIKANSKNVFILSRGLLYKVNYENNTKEQLIFGYRPSFIEVDDDRLYLASGNTFFYLSTTNTVSNQKYFPNNITFLKKHQNIIIVAESDSNNTYFWFSRDYGKNFYKSSTKIAANKTIKDLEIVGDKVYTIYLNLANQGILKGKFIFDFQDQKIFNPPFRLSKDSDLIDKISSFFDHRFPYLGNSTEPKEFSETTLNFEGRELKQPLLYYSSHDGIDFALPLNTSIYSVYDGEATYFYQPNGLGNAIKILHPNGFITIYGHLSNEGLVTNSTPIKVVSGQKIGQVGMSGNTSGPHLHFTAYFGDKLLNNKIDPFGWNAKFTDPWSEIGSTSYYLWKNKVTGNTFQLDPKVPKKIIIEKLSLDISNYSFLTNPISLEIEKTPPIYDSKNYLYISNSSYKFYSSDFSSTNITQALLGTISFSGFKSGDDKLYSIWKQEGDYVVKQASFYDSSTNSLGTIFEPYGQYLILKDNFRKITIKNNSVVKK
jgi:murein DD-endopeptidase MepM/ murein hydrolase activator NlpD